MMSKYHPAPTISVLANLFWDTNWPITDIIQYERFLLLQKNMLDFIWVY